MKYVTVTTLTLCLVGCGGGDASSTSSVAVTVQEVQAPLASTAPNALSASKATAPPVIVVQIPSATMPEAPVTAPTSPPTAPDVPAVFPPRTPTPPPPPEIEALDERCDDRIHYDKDNKHLVEYKHAHHKVKTPH